MDRYCIYCGKTLSETGICTCLSRFSPLVEAETEEQVLQVEEAVSEPEIVPQEEYNYEVPEELVTEDMPEEPVAEEIPKRTVEEKLPEEPVYSAPPRREAPKAREGAEGGWTPPYHGRFATRTEAAEPYYHSRGIGQFLTEYFGDFMGAGRKLASCGDSGYGFIFMLLSMIVTALSTLLYSVIHLDDFLVRWIFVGIMIPVVTFGLTFVFVVLVIGGGRESVSAGKILNTVGLSAIFPTTFQLITAIPSVIDKSGKVFQFSALLIYLVWIFSLYFTVFSAHRVKVRFRTLMITVAFAFLTLVTFRALWMWFLTDYMQFAFYLPTSLYPGELYEAFLSK